VRRYGLALSFLLAASSVAVAATAVADDSAVRRGEYVFRVAGCLGCHTDVKAKGPALAGGRALKTPFGTFYSPNITPDPTHGIGAWSEADFRQALRHGVAPDGSHYFPAFPYAAYTRMADADVAALWAYLRTQPAVAVANNAHDLSFPFNLRFMVGAWKWLYFEAGAFAPDPTRPDSWNRGAYLVEALGHCGECHTPRTWLGGLDGDRRMAGTRDGPEGEKVPNITPEPVTGIGNWSDSELSDLFRIGMLPDGDFAGSVMAEVVEHSTQYLTPDDQQAIIAYLRALPAVRNDLSARK
jgi:mono/diheme cytochrome c family protein